MNIVYRNPEFHISQGEVDYEVWESDNYGHPISDACAQTIASWWHSPASPNSTALSTMGAVTDDMEIGDFVSPKEYQDATQEERDELDALAVYIAEKQKVRN